MRLNDKIRVAPTRAETLKNIDRGVVVLRNLEGPVMTNVAINGLGRIGRATLKIVMETPELNLVAANDIGASDSVEYLLKYDTVYGRYEKAVEATDGGT